MLGRIYEMLENADLYGEEYKIFRCNTVMTIIINENSPDSGLVDFLYNMQDEGEEGWGYKIIEGMLIEWMTLPKEDF